eukprot:TRINITY_DN6471_c0_g2_i1.p1 TRINITY_DN6471_c0_g2~~TRINITY_DN6471_c0_g2_i1.p1  ORF type:complete len:646 (+),score=94.95 TRINITY_DN6471_c0_g2_i1:72-1940(+)
MWMSGAACSMLQTMIAPWSELEHALQQEAHAILPALEALKPSGCWQGVLSFHCFGSREILVKGCHTKVSERRLMTFWCCLQRAFKATMESKGEAMVDLLRQLLEASKGPKISGFDPREPYRSKLVLAAGLLQDRSNRILDKAYKGFSGDAADWLKSEERNFVASDINHDPLIEQAGLKSQDLWGKGLRFRIDPPAWLVAPDFAEIHKDLSKARMISCVADMVRIVQHACEELRVQREKKSSTQAALESFDQNRVMMAVFYAAWLRGKCQEQQMEISKAIRSALGAYAAVGETFFSRKDAKGLTRISERLIEVFDEYVNALKEVRLSIKGQIEADESNQHYVEDLLLHSAAFITDINGCTYVAQDLFEIQRAVDSLWKQFGDKKGGGIRRIKNGFDGNNQKPYRDLKVWLEIPLSVPCLTETIILEKTWWSEKLVMHLPYELFRNSFDWHHLEGVNQETWDNRLQIPLEQLQSAGFELQDMRADGISPSKLRDAGFTAADMRIAGFNAPELKRAGFTSAELMSAGFVLVQLTSAGFTLAELRSAGFTPTEMRSVGFTAAEMRSAGFTVAELRSAGCTVTEMRSVGFTEAEIEFAEIELYRGHATLPVARIDELTQSVSAGFSG